MSPLSFFPILPVWLQHEFFDKLSVSIYMFMYLYVYSVNLNTVPFWGNWLAELMTLDLRVVSSSPMLGVEIAYNKIFLKKLEDLKPSLPLVQKDWMMIHKNQTPLFSRLHFYSKLYFQVWYFHEPFSHCYAKMTILQKPVTGGKRHFYIK